MTVGQEQMPQCNCGSSKSWLYNHCVWESRDRGWRLLSGGNGLRSSERLRFYRDCNATEWVREWMTRKLELAAFTELFECYCSNSVSVPIYLWANTLYRTWAVQWNLKSIIESVLQWPQSHYSFCYVLLCLNYITILVFFHAASTQPLKKNENNNRNRVQRNLRSTECRRRPLAKQQAPRGPDITDGIRPRVAAIPFNEATAKLAAMDSRVF
jgi:hypothetical protein